MSLLISWKTSYIMSLIIRGYSVDVGIVEVNYKDENMKSQRKQYEVDFVCNKGNARYYIQQAYALENQDKINQETRGLNKINDSFKKIVIIKDCYIPWHDENGILYISLEDFLLKPNSLEIQNKKKNSTYKFYHTYKKD